MDHSVAAAVERLNDSMPERERARMERHRTEFYVTLRALREHLPLPPARVLDCGGGPHCNRERLLVLLRGTGATYAL